MLVKESAQIEILGFFFPSHLIASTQIAIKCKIASYEKISIIKKAALDIYKH